MLQGRFSVENMTALSAAVRVFTLATTFKPIHLLVSLGSVYRSDVSGVALLPGSTLEKIPSVLQLQRGKVLANAGSGLLGCVWN